MSSLQNTRTKRNIIDNRPFDKLCPAYIFAHETISDSLDKTKCCLALSDIGLNFFLKIIYKNF